MLSSPGTVSVQARQPSFSRRLLPRSGPRLPSVVVQGTARSLDIAQDAWVMLTLPLQPVTASPVWLEPVPCLHPRPLPFRAAVISASTRPVCGRRVPPPWGREGPSCSHLGQVLNSRTLRTDARPSAVHPQTRAPCAASYCLCQRGERDRQGRVPGSHGPDPGTEQIPVFSRPRHPLDRAASERRRCLGRDAGGDDSAGGGGGQTWAGAGVQGPRGQHRLGPPQ